MPSFSSISFPLSLNASSNQPPNNVKTEHDALTQETARTKDTDYAYRYNGTSWMPISANALPKITRNVDGFLSKEGYQKLQNLTEMSYKEALAILNAHKPDTEMR